MTSIVPSALFHIVEGSLWWLALCPCKERACVVLAQGMARKASWIGSSAARLAARGSQELAFVGWEGSDGAVWGLRIREKPPGEEKEDQGLPRTKLCCSTAASLSSSCQKMFQPQQHMIKVSEAAAASSLYLESGRSVWLCWHESHSSSRTKEPACFYQVVSPRPYTVRVVEKWKLLLQSVGQVFEKRVEHTFQHRN